MFSITLGVISHSGSCDQSIRTFLGYLYATFGNSTDILGIFCTFVLACSSCHLENMRWNAVNYSPNSGTEDWMLLPVGKFRPNAKWGLHIWLPLHLSYFSLSADENKTERLIVQRGKRLFHADWVILKTIYSLASREKNTIVGFDKGERIWGTWYMVHTMNLWKLITILASIKNCAILKTNFAAIFVQAHKTMQLSGPDNRVKLRVRL